MVAVALNLLAIKISVVLQKSISIALLQLAEEKAPVTSKFFQNFTNKIYFSYQNQLNSYFGIQAIRGSGETANKKW